MKKVWEKYYMEKIWEEWLRYGMKKVWENTRWRRYGKRVRYGRKKVWRKY